MQIKPNGFPLSLSDSFIALLNKELSQAGMSPQAGVILNFRDPNYSAEAGGFHPVEISITAEGRILYVTDFAYVGLPPFAELAKELDFDASLGLFQHFGHEYPLEEGRELFKIWQENFVSYVQMGVFTVVIQQG